MVAVAFIHPDLGIGGAERLVCDAALALQKKGHNVKIFTSHHDPKHCFSETADGTLQVETIGDWLPRSIMSRFYAFCAYLRMIVVAVYIVFFSKFNPDVIFCDQVSACIPVLKLKHVKVIFYCHFPDMLLTQRKTFLKYIYRFPLDTLEEYTTGCADIILVNSKFTSQVFKETFKSLSSYKPTVLYPTINFKAFSKEGIDCPQTLKDLIPNSANYIFLSINRYERKKNLTLALLAFKELENICDKDKWRKAHLIIAGGYDERVHENKEYHLELVKLAEELHIIDKITFMRSFKMKEKIALLDTATCLLYTPSNEHFGIVPIEAMYMKCPVIACASGGPLETVSHEKTGFLCDSDPKSFAQSMALFTENDSLKSDMGKQGHERVVKYFSFDAFAENIDKLVNELHLTNDNATSYSRIFLYLAIVFFAIVFAYMKLI